MIYSKRDQIKQLKIYEVKVRTPQLLERLLNIWEDSVRATHLFLTDAEVNQIKEYVPQALRHIKERNMMRKVIRIRFYI